jgi:uncharacterized protein (TIGR03118 family)
MVVLTNVVYSPFTLLAQFVDAQATNLGFAPFNIQVIQNEVFVMYAKQDALRIDDVPGPGNGIVDILTPNNGRSARLITGTGAGGKDVELNSPWAFVLTPDSWGKDAKKILISNFGDGTIATYNLYGKPQGMLQNTEGGNVVIPGLWGLMFGVELGAGDPDVLYFTAGPDSENHGLFGSLVQVPTTKKKK